MGKESAKKYAELFLPAVLAGMMISVGGTVFLVTENRIAGALMFTVGLYTICIQKLNLFTGKVGYWPQQSWGYALDLILIWCGNLAGTFLSALLLKATRISNIAETAGAMCKVKAADSLPSLLVLGIFCGLLMFIAVDGYAKTNSPVILFLGVAAFILCGFEHCIADMFYFSVAGMWSPRTFLCLLVITLGNSLGGMLIPGIRKLIQ